MLMITIHDAKATDFTTMGLGALTPSSAKVDERAGGLYELTIEQPIEEDMRHALIAEQRIIKAPAPVRETPRVELGNASQQVTRRIYKVTTGGERLFLRVAPDQNSKGIHAYRPNTEVAVIDDSNRNWYQVIVLDGGATGYMWAGNLTFVRDETETIIGDTPGTVILPRQTREQLFRIKSVESDSKGRIVTAVAQHISYDLKGVIVKDEYEPDGVAANVVCAELVAKADHSLGDFRIICTVTDPITADYTGRNLLDCLLDPDSGIVAQTNARIIRDNFDIFILPDEQRDRGVRLQYAKNLLSAMMTTDYGDVITRIQPVGKDKDGETLYITENNGFVDSQRINDYPTIYSKRIEYDVVEGKDDMTIDEARAKLKELAEADFADGCDLPSARLDADFVRLELTDAYRDLASAYSLHLYDAVPVIDDEAGIHATVRMAGYTYDILLDRYSETMLGDISEVETTVYGYEIAGGSIGGSKIAAGSVGGDRIRSQSIPYAKFMVAAIKQLSVDALNAQAAYINELTAGTIDADKLTAAYAHLFDLVADKVQAGEITADTITAAMAKLNSVSIKSADIDYAQIKDAVVQSLITRDAVADRYFIDKLQVRNLQVLDQTVGNLVIKAADGKYYRLDIDTANATVTPVQVTPTQSEINAGVTSTQRSIIETSMLVSDLSATNIKGINAIIDKITASRITVDTLFARQATIDALNSYIIKASTIEAIENKLQVWAQEQITLGIGSKVINPNLLAGTDETIKIGHIQNNVGTTGIYRHEPDAEIDYPDRWMRVQDDTVAHTWIRHYFNAADHIPLTVGQTYTLSADIIRYNGRIRIGATTRFSPWMVDTLPYGQPVRIAQTFVAGDPGNWLMIDCERTETSGSLYFDIRKIKLEVGSVATEWRPIDFINSALVIDDKGVRMTGGALEFSAGTMFKVNSGGAVQIDASSAEDSYINLGNGNFSASKQGGVTGDVGNFTKLLVGGKPVLTGDNLPMPVIVSKNNPGKHGVVWLQPSSLSSVDYTNAGYTSRKEANDFGITHTISATFAAVNSDTLPNGTLKYHLEIPLYSLSASIDDMSIAVKLTKGSSSVTMTRVNNIVIRPYNEVIAVCEFTSTTNLCSNANAITVEMTGTRAGATMTEHVYIQKDRALKLTVSTSGSGSAQACNVYYLP